MWVMLSDVPVACEDAVGKRPSEGARALTVGFPDTQPGTTTHEIYGTTANVSGLVTLVSVPSAAGERGRVSFAVKGKKDRLSGETEFVLCAPLVAKPGMAPTPAPVEQIP